MIAVLKSTTIREFYVLTFANHFVQQLPADPETALFVRQVSAACYSSVYPAVVTAPELLLWSEHLADDLSLTAEAFADEHKAAIFSGNELLPGMEPYAMCYGGHQFGNWAGQLGDGRAINLGELCTPTGRQTLQLKGAGMTPYSRHADGLAVLRSSVREYLCSEAMHHLGIPSTRALSLVLSGEQVERDVLYDGNPAFEPGAIVCRVAPSFIRFGSFEIHASRNDVQTLRTLVDYCIQHDFADMAFDLDSPTVYLDWFNEVCQRTLTMIVHWQRVGFVHGVMNTDNMSILGLTIDYGPYGWLDDFDPSWTPNTTDLPGRRYAFANQPKIAHWNLVKLAQALLPLIGDASGLEHILHEYPVQYQAREQAMYASKIGIEHKPEEHQALLDDLHKLLKANQIDMSLFYRQLADVNKDSQASDFSDLFYLDSSANQEPSAEKLQALDAWLTRYQACLVQYSQQYNDSSDARKERMNRVNPWFVLRNFLSQQAIEQAETGDYAMLHELSQVLQKPYTEQAQYAHLVQKRPDWAKHKVGCSMLSCSS